MSEYRDRNTAEDLLKEAVKEANRYNLAVILGLEHVLDHIDQKKQHIDGQQHPVDSGRAYQL